MGIVGRLDQYASMLAGEFDDYSMSENLVRNSENFSTTWVTSNSSIQTDVITTPDGLSTADKLVENTSNTSHYVYYSFTSTATTRYTVSIFLKSAERTKFRIAFPAAFYSSGSASVNYDLTLGTTTVQGGSQGSTTSSIIAYPNGWYRCIASSTVTNAATGQLPQLILLNASDQVTYTGDGTSGIYIWGAQVEESSVATDYTPTTTTVKTRVLPSSTNTNITGLSTYFSSGFSENVGAATTTLAANVFPPYDLVYDDFGGTLFGAGQGRYMRQNNDKSVIVYNEIDEVSDFRDIVRSGLILDLDAGQFLSYKGSGTTWFDLSGRNKNATLVGDQISYSTINGGVFNFNGVGGSDSDYFSLPNTSFTLGANFTIEIWNYYNSASQPAVNPWSSGLYTNSVESDWNAGAGNNNGLVFGYNSIVYRNTSAVEIQVSYSPAPTTRVWHQHVLVVNSGSGTIYVDKTSVASLSNMRTYTQSNGTLGIGIADKSGTTSYRGEYRGYISNVRIYNRVLTTSEIQRNYDAFKHRFGL